MNQETNLAEFDVNEFTESSINNMMRFTDFSPLTQSEQESAEQAIALG
ncbi:hypothetical protein ACN6K9_002974 [Streptomyces sp. SAS_267]